MGYSRVQAAHGRYLALGVSQAPMLRVYPTKVWLV